MDTLQSAWDNKAAEPKKRWDILPLRNKVYLNTLSVTIDIIEEKIDTLQSAADNKASEPKKRWDIVAFLEKRHCTFDM
jgi:hypothetical protein